MFGLAVDVHQVAADFAHQGHRHHTAIQPRGISSVAPDLAVEEDLFLAVQEILISEQINHRPAVRFRDGKHSFQVSPLGVGADEVQTRLHDRVVGVRLAGAAADVALQGDLLAVAHEIGRIEGVRVDLVVVAEEHVEAVMDVCELGEEGRIVLALAGADWRGDSFTRTPGG